MTFTVYSLSQKFKMINSSHIILYQYQLIGGFCYRLKLGSTAALDCLMWPELLRIYIYSEKKSHCYSSGCWRGIYLQCIIRCSSWWCLQHTAPCRTLQYHNSFIKRGYLRTSLDKISLPKRKSAKWFHVLVSRAEL